MKELKMSVVVIAGNVLSGGSFGTSLFLLIQKMGKPSKPKFCDKCD